MNTSPSRPVPGPPITRRYEPSRLQCQTLTNAYQRVIPIVSRRPGSPTCRAGDPIRADAWVGHPGSKVAGA
jgi:hypothetical protein